MTFANLNSIFHTQFQINRAKYENEMRTELLRGADVVCCTLNFSASGQLDVLRSSHFTCCIIDEV